MKKHFISIVLSLLLVCMFCIGCEKDMQCTEHIWQDWQVSKNASCTELGTEKRICSICKETEYKNIPMLDNLKKYDIILAHHYIVLDLLILEIFIY